MIMTNNNSSANKPMSLAEVRERQRKRKLLKPNSATASIGSFAETTHIPRERLPSGTKENAIIADSTRAAESFSSSGKSLLPFKSVKTAAGLSVNQYRRTNWEWLSGTNQEQPEGYMAECTGGGGGGCSSEIDEDSDYEDGVENGVEYFGAATDSDGSMDVDGFATTRRREYGMEECKEFDQSDRMNIKVSVDGGGDKQDGPPTADSTTSTLRRLIEQKKPKASSSSRKPAAASSSQTSIGASAINSTQASSKDIEYATFIAPLEWNVRTDIAITSQESLGWLADPTFEDYASCLPTDQNYSSSLPDDKQDSNNIRRLLRLLNYWHYQAAVEGTANSILGETLTAASASEEWHVSFQSLFYSWLRGGCPYFYYLHQSLNILFLHHQGRHQIRVSPCSGYLLSLLQSSSFDIVPSDANASSNDYPVWKARWNLNSAQSPATPNFSQQKLLAEGTLIIENGAEDAMEEDFDESPTLFYDFLVNNRQKLCAIKSVEAARLLPEFLSPTPFVNSRLRLNRLVRPSTVSKSNPLNGGQVEIYNQFRIRGPILPTHQQSLIQLLALNLSSFECAMPVTAINGFGMEMADLDDGAEKQPNQYRRQLRYVKFDSQQYKYI